jgi:hypothetical protein
MDNPVRQTVEPLGVAMDQRRESSVIPFLNPAKQRLIIRL